MLARYMLWSCVQLFVRPSDCLSQADTVLKMAEHLITKTTPFNTRGLYFSGVKHLGEIPVGLLPTGRPTSNTGGVGKMRTGWVPGM